MRPAVTDLDAIRKPPITNFFAVANTALSIALSPNPENKEFFVSYPFRMDEGKMVPNEPAYSTFRSKMPIYLVDKYRDNLHGLRGLAIDVGEKEEFTHILATTRIFSQKLAEAGVPHTYSIYADGNHSGLIRKRLEDFVIPFFSRTLADAKQSDK